MTMLKSYKQHTCIGVLKMQRKYHKMRQKIQLLGSKICNKKETVVGHPPIEVHKPPLFGTRQTTTFVATSILLETRT
jgi:hypothetical protein